MKYKIEENCELLIALSTFYPKSSKTTLRSWIKEGRVLVNEEIVKRSDYVVITGQSIEVLTKPRVISGNLRIIYQDAHLVAIDKPTGVLSVAANFEKDETVYKFLKQHFGSKRVFVVHRLDQDTSGVMLFALTEKAQEALKEMFEKHEMGREYVAIVEGKFDTRAGTWQNYVYEDPNYVMRVTEDPQKGKKAVTHYTVIGNQKNFTRLKLTLETGRKNQIRVHCQQAGHPVIGDKKYGAKTNPIKRIGLHARCLSFLHPILKKNMSFVSPIPPAFDNLVP